jgi:hypothetical protein
MTKINKGIRAMWDVQRKNPTWYGSGKNRFKKAKPEQHPSVIMYEYLKKNGHPEP